MSRDIGLRATFNSEARLYHAVRPRYPEALFDALVQAAELRNDSQLLEIGPGTGQATEPLARRGYAIVAVELGANLATTARQALKAYKNVQVITGVFEDIELPSESFDLVYAATALYWIKPEVRFSKPHRLLNSNGHLAIIAVKPVSDEAGDKPFFALQPIYQKYKPVGLFDENYRMPRAADLKSDDVDEILFTSIGFETFPLVVRYTAAEYAQLLNTYSPIISMESESRAGFLKSVTNVIEERFGGSIMRHLVMTLTIAKKKNQ